MKWWSVNHIFNYPWEKIIIAAIKKYSSGQFNDVIGIDTIDRSIDEHGLLRSHRLLNTKWGYVSEHSIVDPKNKTFNLWSRNLNTLSNKIIIEEHLLYSALWKSAPVNPGFSAPAFSKGGERTHLLQSAKITAPCCENFISNQIETCAKNNREKFITLLEKGAL